METLEKLISQVKSTLNVTRMISPIRNWSLFLHHIYHNTFHIVVAHWWWMNMQDDECTAGAEIDSWVKDISDNVKDEMNLVSNISKIDSDKQLAGLNDGQNFTTENQTQNDHHRSGIKKRQQVYVWNPPQNL